MDMNAFDFDAMALDGSQQRLSQYRGHVLLVVNVASKCGFTPQYAGLETLWRDYAAQGLVVLGFPCDQFGHQEPGDADEIKNFCSLNYDVTFPMFAKISVAGADVHPLYQQLVAAQPVATGEGPMREKLVGFGIEPNPAPGILWNFEKFLVGRDGQVIGRFSPDTTADDAGLRAAIDAALAA